MAHTDCRLPAEWERQSATLLAWPPAESDWSDQLASIRDEYRELIAAIVKYQPVVLLVAPSDVNDSDLPRTGSGLHTIKMPFNDTWCRDFGPITLVGSGQRLALDFHFNGWGGKHPAALDNRVNTHLSRHSLFARFRFRQYLFELEGGAIDTDGRGRLLVNRHCLRARHPHLSDGEIDHELHSLLNIDEIVAVDVDPAPGDDTDGHIDTLARFVSEDTLVFQLQRDPAQTRRLLGQLEAQRRGDGKPYRLVALPCPDDLDVERPASYTNFLFVNGACLVPAYGSRQDEAARAVLEPLLPNHEVIGVPAATMITQSGGPHCATMHIPGALG